MKDNFLISFYIFGYLMESNIGFNFSIYFFSLMKPQNLSSIFISPFEKNS
jgi:hypothetical protein